MSRKFKKSRDYIQKGPKNLVIMVIFLVVSFALLRYFAQEIQKINTFSYKTFIEKVEQNEVKDIVVSGQEVTGTLTNNKKFETVFPEGDKDIWALIKDHKIDITARNSAAAGQFTFWHFILLMMAVFGGIMVWHFLRQARGGSGGGGGGLFNMGKSKAKMFMPSMIKETFDSVAGAGEAKEELKDVVDYLKNPSKFSRLGAKMTKGVLLVGEPGTGKTLLARAVAGEANCPFFSISGSDFIEVFVGVGAARVRDLFEQARKKSPSIIFIDEIDAVGRHRGSGLGGGHDEREQTLNQLLTEMDGFETNKEPVIVIAATNRQDVLDKALLRPGRFDRIVHMPYPDLKSREQILQVHAKKINIDPDVDLKKIARGTPGFTGADLENLINEAAISASKKNRKMVEIEDFEEARDKLMLGKEHKSIMLTEEDKRVTAYHEAGHTLVALLTPGDSDPLHKVTIIPRGRALGVTHSLPEREKYTQSKDEMTASIMMALGGRIAEEIEFNKMYTGASSDFQAASRIARNMITQYGMSPELGQVIYGQAQGDFVYSQKTAEYIDKAVKDLVDACYKDTRELLETNRDKLTKLSEELLDKETLYARDIYVLLDITPRKDFKWTDDDSADEDREPNTGDQDRDETIVSDDSEKAPA
ncbi:ATP-dependent zinc metalloprotease FtsH [bacterium]|jgi:cell division protease FtsH|nr:ATP-dependent zinc metalloprotease FtsH [bacterium]MBT5015279.1 ATP-dependent zinc metalloprotease FtsH [bacterium]